MSKLVELAIVGDREAIQQGNRGNDREEPKRPTGGSHAEYWNWCPAFSEMPIVQRGVTSRHEFQVRRGLRAGFVPARFVF